MSVKRNNKGQFVKGSKPLGGRPRGSKGIAAYIKDNTNNLKELIDMALDLLRNERTVTKDKITLLNMLLDRSIGRPIQHQQLENVTPVPIQFVEIDK